MPDSPALAPCAPPEAFLLDERETAVAMKVSRSTLRRLAKSGELCPVRLPGVARVLYRVSDVQAFLATLAAGHGRS